MDIDDIFKRPPLPKGSTKRKFEHPIPDFSAEAAAKAIKLDNGGADKGKGRAVTIEDGSGDEDEDEGGEFAPGGDADYFEEEDPEGRFFGGGLNDVQKQVLNIMDSGNETDPADLTPQSVKKQLLTFEKAINKNRDQRTRYSNDPEKRVDSWSFVDSEFALVESLNGLLLLASKPAIAYPLLLELSTPSSLADLLSHENQDVVIAVIEALEEWTDEEVLEVEEDEDEDADDQRREAMKGLVAGLMEAGVIELIVSGLERFNEEDESERAGVFHALGLIENLLSLTPDIATSLFSPKSPFIKYLLARLGADKLGPDFDQNRFYAGELLAILLGLPVDGVREGRRRLAEGGAVDGLLKVLSAYRRKDPSSADEIEFMENIFDLLCSALSEEAVKAAFLEGEGIELMCLMLKEKKLSRTRAIKTLDYALQGPAGIPLCEKFVEMLGLKTLFSAFMGKNAGKKAKGAITTHEDNEHVLSIVSSLLTSLASDSPSRLRLLAKFVEADYEKVDRLLELREDVEARVSVAGKDAAELEMDEDELYLEKLDKGLFSLQLIDYIVGWLCMEDDGVRDHIRMLLSRKDQSFSDVIRVLKEYRENVGDASLVPAADDGDAPDAAEEQRVILGHLISYLEGIDV
ncbi:beta-catenin-like protein 1 [Pseudohyphozyma bogoriensis]|nr:beta-catenin-like protein 1 [Pseudohyphozyma bogoriensis]